MNNLKSLLLIALAAFSMTSCELDNICEGGEGPTVTKELTLGEFTGIDLDVSATVFVTQGEEFQVTAEGQENIINMLELDINNDVWEIDYDQNCVGRHNGLSIYVTMPAVERLEVNGSGEIISENVLEASTMDLRIKGSGDMDLALAVSELNTRIDGSGGMKLEGTADDIEVVIRGSGDLKGFDLDVLRADVNVDGSGDVELSVSEFIRVEIDGSGDVFFRGDADLESDINGSGDVRRIN